MGDDGFYYGECNGYRGLVPSTLIEEMPTPGSASANLLLVCFHVRLQRQRNHNLIFHPVILQQNTLISAFLLLLLFGSSQANGAAPGQDADRSTDEFDDNVDDVPLPEGPSLLPGSIVVALYEYEPMEMSPNENPVRVIFPSY